MADSINYREAKLFWQKQEGGRTKVGRSRSFRGYFDDPRNQHLVAKVVQSPAGFPATQQTSNSLHTNLHEIAKSEKPVSTSPIPIPPRPKPTHQTRSSFGSSAHASVSKNTGEKEAVNSSTPLSPKRTATPQVNAKPTQPIAPSTPTPPKRTVAQLNFSSTSSTPVGARVQPSRPLPPKPIPSSSPPESKDPHPLSREKRSITTPPIPISRKNSASLEPSPASIDSPSSPKRRFFSKMGPQKNGGKDDVKKAPEVKKAEVVEFQAGTHRATFVKVESEKGGGKVEPAKFQSIMPGVEIGRKGSGDVWQIPLSDQAKSSKALKEESTIPLTEEAVLSLEKRGEEAALNCSKTAESLRKLIGNMEEFAAKHNSDKVIVGHFGNLLSNAESQMNSLQRDLLSNAYRALFFNMKEFNSTIAMELENNIAELISKMKKCIDLVEMLHETLQMEDVYIREYVNRGADTKTKIGTGLRLMFRKEINKGPLLDVLASMKKEFGLTFQSRLASFSKALQADEEDSVRTFEQMAKFFEALSKLTAVHIETIGYRCTNIVQNGEPCRIQMGTKSHYTQSETVEALQLLETISRDINNYLGPLKEAGKNALAFVEFVKKQPTPFSFPCEKNAKEFQKLLERLEDCLDAVNKRRSQIKT